MSSIPVPERMNFERWVIETHPQLFSEWETEAAEYIDLDDWMEREHCYVTAAWRHLHRGKQEADYE